MPEQDAEAAANHLAAVSLKLPNIWPNNLELWFRQVESQFTIKNITQDDTKFHHVVAVLDENSARRVATLLSTPPATGKYDALKTKLLERCGLSELTRAQQLLHLDGLGDRRPTDLLAHMQALRGTMDLEVLFRALFLEQLPQDIRVNLAASPIKQIDDIAQLADDMMQGKNPTPAGISSASSKTVRLCYYHKRFRNKAKRCVQPCDFKMKPSTATLHDSDFYHDSSPSDSEINRGNFIAGRRSM